MRLFALVLLFCASGMALAQKASTSAGKPPASTYDPILAQELSLKEWASSSRTIPLEQLKEKGYEHLLTRRKAESDQALAFRIYAELDAAQNLSKAQEVYTKLKQLGYGDSHRWLYVAQAGDDMYFADIRTSTSGSFPSYWIQTRRFGIHYTNEFWAFDCSSRRSRINAATSFNLDGSVKETSSIPTEWAFVSPSSVGEAMLDFSCS